MFLCLKKYLNLKPKTSETYLFFLNLPAFICILSNIKFFKVLNEVVENKNIFEKYI